MKNEERIIELLSEMVKGQDQTNQRLDKAIDRLDRVESEMHKLNTKVHKLNAQTQENTRAIVKLADKMEETLDLEKRVRKLETAVFK